MRKCIFFMALYGGWLMWVPFAWPEGNHRMGVRSVTPVAQYMDKKSPKSEFFNSSVPQGIIPLPIFLSSSIPSAISYAGFAFFKV